jgi:pseudouridine synthase
MTEHIIKIESRANKAIADLGLCSRREADKLIQSGKVVVNGKQITLGRVLMPGDRLTVKSESKNLRYALYYKPRGEVTGENAKDLLAGLHPVGRLDKESDGLLIYTNDHRVVDALLNPKNKIEKEYRVNIREKATPRVERILLDGITTQEGEYEPVKKVFIHDDGMTVDITLTEGKKHEIRRMMNALNLTINSLTRTRITFLSNKYMRPSQAKELTDIELEKLFKILKLELI